MIELGPASAPPPSRGKLLIGLGLLGLCVVVVIQLFPPPVLVERMAADPSASPDAGVELPPRCTMKRSVAHQVGVGVADEEQFVPYAPELGPAVTTEDGFAVGIKRERDGVVVAEVALIPMEGDTSTLDVGRSRGDIDPPLVVAGPRTGQVTAALNEPNASGMALRLALLDAAKATWGAEFEQGRDDSLAFSVAMSPTAGVVAWDTVPEESSRSRVMLARVSPELAALGASRTVSREEVDGESPQLVAHADGFWLAYVASKPLPDEDAADDKRGPEADQYAAELIEPSWLELLPLDADGVPTGVPREVTPRLGRVLAFDLAANDVGEALIAWRDDDTPMGAHGGRVTLLRIGMSGSGEFDAVAEDDVGSGVPTLLGGWLAVPDREGRTRLAPLDPSGRRQGELRLEEVLGEGMPLAAKGDSLLLSRAYGKVIELSVAECVAAR